MITVKRIAMVVGILVGVIGAGWIGLQFWGGRQSEPVTHSTDLTHGSDSLMDGGGQNGVNLDSGTNLNIPKTVSKLKKRASQPQQQTSGSTSAQASHQGTQAAHSTAIPGVAFLDAATKPLFYELHERLWGWRPNDVVDLTDNVHYFQLGVLEVTRRTAVALAENISRTGRTDAYVPSLELAMNWFMIKPTKYWFPSAEAKYQEGLDELLNYQKMLKMREARFYRRVDNLVPLLRAFESILGSCDENLVKNLGKMSPFKADDYFYYTKGVASAMYVILEAVALDFGDLVHSVQGEDVLHHGIVSLQNAAKMNPWLVLEGSPDGILANHRANMAGPISHARFYLGVLSTALTGNIN